MNGRPMASPRTPVGRAKGSTTSAGRRRVLFLVALFLLGWAVSAIATLPLTVLAPWLEQATDMRVTATSGSIWQGGTRLASDNGAIDIDLKFRPSALLRAALEWEVSVYADGVEIEATVRPSWRATDSVILPSLQADISADSPWLVEHSPLPLRGHFRLEGTDWRLSPMPREGDWELTWLDAGIAPPMSVELGTLQAEGRIEDGRLDGRAQSRQDDQDRVADVDLHLGGTMNTGLVLEGHLAPTGQSDLTAELRLIGTPTDDGRIHIRQVFGNPTPAE